MRTLALLILDVILGVALFLGVQACRGIFGTFGDFFSFNIWAAMSAKDAWIFFGCMLLALGCVHD